MRRKVIALVCALAALASLTPGASAATVYEGNISTTYLTYFQDIAGKLPIGDHYVFYRSGQYEYTMIAGDLTYDGSTFTADEAKSYILGTTSTYNAAYQYSTGTVTAWSLTPGTALIYSSLGDYPDLIDPTAKYDFAIMLLIMICICLYLVNGIFKPVRRRW